MNTTIQNRIHELRDVLRQNQLAAVIIPSSDPHLSEYVPEAFKARAYFSGFTGSVGTLVVGLDFAHLWVDSRYFVQGELQLQGTGIELKKLIAGQGSYGECLLQCLAAQDVVAVDSALWSAAEFVRLRDLFATKDIQLVHTDIVNAVWRERPSLPCQPIYAHDEHFVDLPTAEKLAQVRARMQKYAADYHILASLDDIAWLTNLRGSDVEYNPVFLSYVLLGKDTATLFVHTEALTESAKAALDSAGFVVRDYAAIFEELGAISGAVLLDNNKVSWRLVSALPDSVATIAKINPSTLLKAVKSEKALAHIQEAMAQDGAALCAFFADFEARLASGEALDETDITALLIEARSRQPHYRGPSFDTIAGFAEHGAIVHYSATKDSAKKLQGDGLLLIDSGCQYDNGTTDITRMMGIGTVCDAAKQDVTYVLKAHIALAQAVFIKGTPAPQLDMIARQPMWKVGLDYGHGTGHGVGYFLNVHEGPQSIAHITPITPERTMLQGMVSSNEPGVYRTGKWGVRIENVVACVKAFESEFGEFLRFEDLTLCPIDTRIILPELLDENEKSWLNAYHQKVHDALIDRVEGDAKAWLIARTQAI